MFQHFVRGRLNHSGRVSDLFLRLPFLSTWDLHMGSGGRVGGREGFFHWLKYPLMEAAVVQ